MQTRTAPADAAFVNAISGHALDFDDSLPSLCGHPSVPLCATGFAAAAGCGISGLAFLSAFVLSLEVAGKISRALEHGHYGKGWHPTSTVGVFSTTAMAARLMGLNTLQLRHAFGIAAAQSAGMVRNFGTMAKPFQAGHAARAGYMAAWLAREGMTASDTILEGPRGYIAAYGDAHSDLTVPAPGDPWEIFEPGIYVKRWPCCYGNHRALAGIFALMDGHQITPDEVVRVDVGFLPDADKALIHKDPRTALAAKFSIEYCAAAAIVDGKVTLGSFTDAAVMRPDIRQVMTRIMRVPMPGEGSFSGVVGYTDVTIVTPRGAFGTRIDQTPGSPGAPMTPQDRREKFMGCTLAVLGRDRAEALLGAVEGFAQVADVDAVAALTVPA
jgi:2-methylcitrate dehydratase PrpD